jgi:hypothetical protein
VFPYEFYKVVHFLGILTIFSVLGGIALHALNGGTRQSNAGRAMIGALHGTALVLILVGGFGMMARLGMANVGWPGWLVGKLVIWGVIGVFGMMPYRKPGLAKPALIFWPLLGGLAAWLVVTKPF